MVRDAWRQTNKEIEFAHEVDLHAFARYRDIKKACIALGDTGITLEETDQVIKNMNNVFQMNRDE